MIKFSKVFPSEAHDEVWLTLVTPALSRITYEEMAAGDEDPDHLVAVADEKGGYMGSLGVYHELHCLEHYYSNLAHNSSEDIYELDHLGNCLEAIQLSLMCAGNTSLYSFQWPNNNKEARKPKTSTASDRTCVDWSRIEQWTLDRSIGLSPRLKRPKVSEGHAYMDHGNEDRD
ncbi:hypothetical protein K469DRAFT_594516 [Zopfia rhizophila CBS 207.26]|uniref:Uncharacterized protein n=1 Tax=Zopfia rhizophila CBS 207.26 TaxID=1314779 RepID=A0A6A6DN76_9PEZI|nr:hypothetical protein K469DRAFT_594516 [Zopfia rhizophila CBS 207.26]